MACGYGACFGCVVPLRGGGYLRLCVDGPVLDADRWRPACCPGTGVRHDSASLLDGQVRGPLAEVLAMSGR